jgi:hypothetical protein
LFLILIKEIREINDIRTNQINWKTMQRSSWSSKRNLKYAHSRWLIPYCAVILMYRYILQANFSKDRWNTEKSNWLTRNNNKPN